MSKTIHRAAPLAPSFALRSEDGARPSWARLLAIGAALLGLIAVTLLVRWPFLHVPLTQDEGGYAYVAREWDSGARLYSSAAWVDRPQGLMLLFRLMIHVAPTIAGLRLFGALYAAASALLLVVVGARLYGAAAGVVAGLCYAIFASSPHIEGFIVNGELLSALPTIAAIACLLLAQRGRRGGVFLLLAGLCAGAALLIKQSAIDGLVALIVFAPLGRGQAARERAYRLILVLCGVAIPLLLSVLHGLLTGWHAYLDAVVLDNLRYRAAEAGKISPERAITGFKTFWGECAFLIIAAACGLIALLSRRDDRTPSRMVGWTRWLPVLWLVAALYAVTLGGLYYNHYFLQLLPPLSVLAALGLVAVVRLAYRWPAAILLLLLPLAGLLNTARNDAALYIGSTPLDISQRLYGWAEYADQRQLAAFLRARVPPGQPFFVAYASPELYYLTERPNITPYLWRRPLGELPGAYDHVLHAVAQGEPVCIVIVQSLSGTPGDQRMRPAIGSRYATAWSRPGVTILCRPQHSA